MEDRTKNLLDWARTQPWWDATEALMRVGLVVVIHTHDGPPLELVPPERREEVARLGGVIFAAAMHRTNGSGFAVYPDAQVTPYALIAAPKGATLGHADAFPEFPQSWGRAGPVTVGEA